MGDRWVLGWQGLCWSDGIQAAPSSAVVRLFAARQFWPPYGSVGASTNDTETMMMLGLGARWVLARHGLAGTRWTFPPATRGLTCTNGTSGVPRDQRARDIHTY